MGRRYLLLVLLSACTPDARTASSYGGSWGNGPIGDDSLRAPAAASSAGTQVYPDVARCFVDQPRHGWVKLRVHLTSAGKVEKIEDEGSTAEVAAIECAMRAIAEGGFPPCTGCGHYEHHVELEVTGEPPAQPIPEYILDGGMMPPPLPPEAPAWPPAAASPDAGPVSPEDHWL
jgi:hypothetical protein